MRYLDSVTEAYVQNEYTVRKYSSLKAIFEDDNIVKHFLAYDFVAITDKSSVFTINMRKVQHILFQKNKIILKLDNEVITITPESIDVSQ
jgi:hypothetical protein